MKTYKLVVPCHFGLEAVLKREIYDLGYEIEQVEDGRITFYRRCGGNLPCQYFSADGGARINSGGTLSGNGF